MLEQVSEFSTHAIAVVALLHTLAFIYLAGWARKDRHDITTTLTQFTEGLPHRSQMDWNAHPSDRIEGFLADIDDVLAEPPGSPGRKVLHQRMKILDERRRYLQSMRFDTVWNVARTMIEAYPLAGVLGTICAIGAALAGGDTASVGDIVGRFGDAIWSTFAGLVSAILLMFIHSMLEPGFSRLSENRRHVRDTVAKAKRELASNGEVRDAEAVA
ncbi:MULTISPECIES: MotA/TolQ/ExbB proton channel family protein [Crateriforma]|uniref:MotA/TolQ/ExbB proton channel family protein n=1 Tax=Crateriforma conspicua TaxID=2527996 RepID=A0A5C6FSA4_9PLAN|nr:MULTISPECIES: MotA/TolQ/ExbB proton channel family protein [Crateriforma]TWU65146.1 MotA/TolQ/ExbB proton channel family protein [Crateriforma conspicua]